MNDTQEWLRTQNQIDTVNSIVKEFLKFVWHKGLPTPDELKSRHEALQIALEKCGDKLDAYWVIWLVYDLEQVASEYIRKLIDLVQATNPKVVKEIFPDIPDHLINVAEGVRMEEVRNMARKKRLERERKNENTPKASAKRLVRMEWDKWKQHPSLYRGNDDFAAKMEIKYQGNNPEKGLITHGTIAKKWIPEWTQEARIYNDWLVWEKHPELYSSDNKFALTMLDKHLTLRANTPKNRRELHYKIVANWIPKWRAEENSPYQ
jgi:hypothetical protein